MLIIFGGLPATGKTTIAKQLAAKLMATYVRVDTIEQSLIACGTERRDIEAQGYFVANAMARDNLKLGRTVIADSVNSIAVTRHAWQKVADDLKIKRLEIEIICSDKQQHRSRVERRTADIAGHQLPNWSAVISREYEHWPSTDMVIDTGQISATQAVERIMQKALLERIV